MRPGERGYALLLAIVVIAVLAFSVLAAARVASDVNASAARLRDHGDLLAAENAATRVAFLVLVQDADGRAVGIGDATRWQSAGLAFDGRWYAVETAPALHVALQDEAGLFDLNNPDQSGLASLLRRSGAGEAAPTLAATLADYVDGDDLVRDRGAERAEYRRAGLAPPADRALATRWQALEVLGWRAQLLDRSPAWDWLTAGSAGGGININSAPRPVLDAVLDDARLAQAVIERRQVSALTDPAELEGLIGAGRVARSAFSLVPGREFRVRAVFSSGGARHGIERRLELGGEDAMRPFIWAEQRELRLAPIRDDQTITSLSLAPPAP
jgi:type II secretory pathway component PulK